MVPSINALIQGPFDIKTAGAGHCSVAQVATLDGAFQDAMAMSTAAVAAIDQVSQGRLNWFGENTRVSETLLALFGITTGSFFSAISTVDAARLLKVRSEATLSL
jgi:hypothetical protein